MAEMNTTQTHQNENPVGAMKGAEVVVRCLENLGVETVFAYPGGSAIELNQALSHSKMRVILPRHEQGGGFMASGYARSTGKVGVAFATSGPGATNLVTTIADAYMDSIPTIFITGQVFSSFIGKQAFQETDFFGMTLPVVKHSFLVLKAEDIPEVVYRAYKIATTGRPGPVVIDIPKDVQQAVFVPKFPTQDLTPHIPGKLYAMDEELQALLRLISSAKKPVLYIGGGVISSESSDLLREFAKLTGVPVVSTLMGLGAFPAEDEQSLYWFGMHGTIAGNWAVYYSDLLIAMGARFDDRVTGVVSKFAPTAKIVHIDVDRSEHGKNKKVDMPIEGELHDALTRLVAMIKSGAGTFKKPDLTEWFKTINEWKKDYKFPFSYDRGDCPHILPQEAIEALYQETHGDAIVCTGVGQHQMWTPQYFMFNKPRTFISSLGAGTMGFGLPAACGVAAAFPQKTVINVDGDGSVLMNIQELATMTVEKLAVKCVIINNQHLGMVAQWEDCFYNSNRGQTLLGDVKNVGSPDNIGGLFPDFVTIAKGFGVPGRRVIKREELHDAIREMLDTPGPFVLDVVVPYGPHVMPFIPQKCSALDVLITQQVDPCKQCRRCPWMVK